MPPVLAKKSHWRYDERVEVAQLKESFNREGNSMERVAVAEAGRDFTGLVSRVCSAGVGVDLQQGDSVIAYLAPAPPSSKLKVRDLDAFVQAPPSLEDDADAFLADVRELFHR
jgi:hypothetical protein